VVAAPSPAQFGIMRPHQSSLGVGSDTLMITAVDGWARAGETM
jgi:hypothetical protein